MPGIAPARKNARWISLAALFAYLGVLVLLAFGHRCAPAGGMDAQRNCAAGSDYHGPSVQTASAVTAHDLCLACGLQQQTTSLAPPESEPTLVPRSAPAPAAAPTPAPRASHASRLPSRGPPHS